MDFDLQGPSNFIEDIKNTLLVGTIILAPSELLLHALVHTDINAYKLKSIFI